LRALLLVRISPAIIDMFTTWKVLKSGLPRENSTSIVGVLKLPLKGSLVFLRSEENGLVFSRISTAPSVTGKAMDFFQSRRRSALRSYYQFHVEQLEPRQLLCADVEVPCESLPPQIVIAEQPFSYLVSKQVFEKLGLSEGEASLAATDGSELPAWLSFDQERLIVHGVPPLTAADLSLEVRGENDSHVAIVTFDLIPKIVDKRLVVDASSPLNQAIRLRNTGSEDAVFQLGFNGRLLYDASSAVAEIYNMPEEYGGESIQRKAWRFVRDNRYRHFSFSNSKWAYNSSVFLNSFGAGRSGVANNVLLQIWKDIGFQARQFKIGGHSVAEVFTGERWELYDAQNAVYYLNDGGNVAGFAELQSDPNLITNPRELVAHASTTAYSDKLADRYASLLDNREWSPNIPKAPNLEFTLPAGGQLTLPTQVTDFLNSQQLDKKGEFVKTPIYKEVVLDIAEGWSGHVSIPLAVHQIVGAGQVTVDGTVYEISSAEFQQLLQERDTFIHDFVFQNLQTDVSIIYLINASISMQSKNTVTLDGDHVDAIIAELVENSALRSGPYLVDSIPELDVYTGQTVTYVVPDSIFSSPLTLSYTADTLLPDWIAFSEKDRSLTVTHSSEEGQLLTFITATDPHGATATAQVRINVRENLPPVVKKSLKDQFHKTGQPFAYQLPKQLAEDTDSSEPLQYSAVLDGNQPLPEWLHFDSTRLVVHGTSPVAGPFSVLIRATDQHGLSVESTFIIDVSEPDRTFSIESETPTAQAIRLTNDGANDARFQMKFNGKIFSGTDEVIAQIYELPDEYADEPLQRKAWRFLQDNSRHHFAYSKSKWVYDSNVFLNSLGVGLAGLTNNVLVQIWRDLGFQARQFKIGGHSVGEVFNGERWELYDARNKVYYRDDGGSVVGLAELQSNPDLITHPRDPLPRATTSAYGEKLKESYATVFDNIRWDPLIPNSANLEFVLPSGGRLTLPYQATNSLRIDYGSDGKSAESPLYKEMVLEIPKGWSGEVNIPLAVHTIVGEGQVIVGESSYAISSSEFQRLLRDRDDFIHDFVFQDLQTDVSIIYLINESIAMQSENTLALDGENVDEIVAELVNLRSIRPGPTIIGTLPEQVVVLGETVTHSILEGVFDSPLPLRYSVDPYLPKWISFDEEARKLTITPLSIGQVDVFITATDLNDVKATAKLRIVAAENLSPVVNAPLTNQHHKTNQPFLYPLPKQFVTDADSIGGLRYAATFDGEQPLPQWLHFDSSALVVHGTAPSAGLYSIVIRATDEHGVYVDSMFTLNISDPDKTFNIAADAPAAQAIRLENQGTADARFQMKFNGNLFSGIDDIAAQIYELPDEYVDEPLQRKAWRFVRDNRYHHFALTRKKWMQDAQLYLNSVGFGLCGNTAFTLSQLWRELGFETRMYNIGGHTMSEAFVGDHWEMYDADLEVYYVNDAGRVAGIAELERDSDLITNPRQRLAYASPYAYGNNVAKYYSTPENNFERRDRVDAVPDLEFTLPVNARMTLPVKATNELTAPYIFRGEQATIAHYREVLLEIPSDWEGQIDIPLLVHSIQGVGTVRVGGREFELNSSEFQTLLDERQSFIYDFEFSELKTDLSIIYLLNPNIQVEAENVIAMDGENLEGIVVDLIDLAEVVAGPTVANPIADQTMKIGETLLLTIPEGSFQSDTVLTLSTDSAITPNWVTLSPDTGIFEFRPTTTQRTSVFLTATDANGVSISTRFSLTVDEA
jgi:predicted HTH domain antitoxin